MKPVAVCPGPMALPGRPASVKALRHQKNLARFLHVRWNLYHIRYTVLIIPLTLMRYKLCQFHNCDRYQGLTGCKGMVCSVEYMGTGQRHSLYLLPPLSPTKKHPDLIGRGAWWGIDSYHTLTSPGFQNNEEILEPHDSGVKETE